MRSKKPPTIHLPDLFSRIYGRKWSFLTVFFFVFLISFSTLRAIDLVPSAFRLLPAEVTPSGTNEPTDSGQEPADEPEPIAVASGQGELPIRIEIPSIGIQTAVANPKAADIASLDRALLGGAVRYPGSGIPGEEGNVLIFGHSSHLPVVHNQAFRAFNDIQNLKKGDPIFVIGDGKVYVYLVDAVAKANTATDGIPLQVDGAKLTLATCDNFGDKSDRYIVTATLVNIDTKE